MNEKQLMMYVLGLVLTFATGFFLGKFLKGSQSIEKEEDFEDGFEDNEDSYNEWVQERDIDVLKKEVLDVKRRLKRKNERIKALEESGVGLLEKYRLLDVELTKARQENEFIQAFEKAEKEIERLKEEAEEKEKENQKKQSEVSEILLTIAKKIKGTNIAAAFRRILTSIAEGNLEQAKEKLKEL